MNFVILGKPGAGKGSICEEFKKNNLIHLSTGDIFRREIASQSELGLLANSYIRKGNLVPDEVTNDIIKKILVENPNKDYIFDGYPRTINQAQALKKNMDDLGIELDAVINLIVDDDLVIERLSSRRVCKKCGAIYNTRNHNPKVEGVCDKCGGEVITRADDKIEAIKERLNVYNNQTAPLIDYYIKEGLIMNVDGSLETIDLYQVVMKNLNERKSLSSINL